MQTTAKDKYVKLNSISMWYDEQGSGEPLVMLHPGGVDATALGPNWPALAANFHVYMPEQRGHGHTPDAEGPYSFEVMADDTIHFIEQVIGGPVRLFGVSDGAIVALHVAHQRPDLVQRLVCAAGVVNNTGWAPGVIVPTEEIPGWLIASYKKFSPDPIEHLPVVVKKLDDMHMQGSKLTIQDLGKITCRTLVIIGDDDEVILEHAIDFYRALPLGELCIIPGTSHGLLVEKPDLCNKILVDFMTLDPIQTYAPIRRA